MKIFDVRHSGSDYYTWFFQCKADHCDNCKLRFFCFTNGKTIVIQDTKLVNMINRQAGWRFTGYSQRKARKLFFQHMGV